jgi:hypothetical protein
MKKNPFFFILWLSQLLLFLFTGCTPDRDLQVEVSGIRLNNLMLTEPQYLSVCFAERGKNVDPFLGDKIPEKMQKLLLSKGYKVTCNRPDFYCTFNCGISSSSTMSYAIPVSGPGDRKKDDPDTKKRSSNGAVYVPYSYNVSGCYLVLELHSAIDYEKSIDSEPVWVGEITSQGTGSDLRAVMDCMLVAACEHFTENTKNPVTESISLNDKRVKSINQIQ